MKHRQNNETLQEIAVGRRREELRNAELRNAIERLMNISSFSEACRIYEQTESMFNDPQRSPYPRRQALDWFDAHAENYVGLITDAEIRDAYLVVLNQLLFPQAYELLFGSLNLQPLETEGLELLEALRKKLRHWQYQGFAKTRATVNVGTHASDWPEIEIRFLSEERIQISVNDQLETRNYAEMGFRDRRNGKPNAAWALFKVLGLEGGVIALPNDRQRWAQMEKRIQELRKVLRSQFGLGTDPLPHIKGTGYQALFKISSARSYET
jgi:hypothetical protein